MKDLILHLERIADANKDEFEFKIEGEVNHRLKGDISVSFAFYCREAADGHDFVSAYGRTPDEAAAAITVEKIKEACNHWHYKYVD